MAQRSNDYAAEVSSMLRDVAASAGPAVVGLGSSWRGGSGVVLADGFVLTNAHNVRGEEQLLRLADGRRITARVAGIDLDGDIALLAADTGITPIEWAGEPAVLGSLVVAVAADGGSGRVTMGTISSVSRTFAGPRGRPITGGVEHTAPLAPGSSGSALLDGAGRLVGLNTNRLGGGFYVALPADETLQRRVAALQRGESVERPRLGVGIAPAHAARRLRRAVGLPERDGLLVREVEEGSPAERAGIDQGDLIVAAGERALADADDLHEVLGTLEPGATLTLTLVRASDERRTEVSFG